MTDKDKLKNLFDEWGVPYEEDEEDTNTIVLKVDSWKDKPKVTGYPDFVTHFTFNNDGSFEQIGIWE